MIPRRTFRAALAVLIGAALLALPGAASAAEPALQPGQPVVDAGQAIGFTGSGFTPGERVVTWATAPDQAVIGGTYADAGQNGGEIAFHFSVPANALGGRWAMTAYGLASKVPVVAFFDVNGRPPEAAVPPGAVAPESGPPGTRFAFAAFGYEKGERVSYWLTGPDGKVHAAYPDSATANSDGRVDVIWIAPPDALHGTWVITIQGLKSNRARGVPFEIRP
ncbi:MAG TPA: hypothetical protein VFO07_10960 [Roseiflexaceae bacterium]|nr:hypothetical protein [Roseiflexaceae bacterium]